MLTINFKDIFEIVEKTITTDESQNQITEEISQSDIDKWNKIHEEILKQESVSTLKGSRDGVKFSITESGTETLLKVSSTNRGGVYISVGYNISSGLEAAKKVYMNAFDDLIEKVKKLENSKR